MHIRTFRASSLQEALAEIREQMGPEAAVLHTRQTRGGLLGWAGRKQVEVTAGLRVELPSRLNQYGNGHTDPEVVASVGRVMQPAPTAGVAVSPGAADARDAKIMQSISELAQAVDSLRQKVEQEPEVKTTPIADELSSLGLDARTCDHLWQLANRQSAQPLADDLAESWPAIIQAAASIIRIGNPIRAQRGKRRTVALVGPTGVGKTTTIAKLAAGFRLQTGLQVGLLTVDTFRLGAVDQLRGYAQIMDLPMEVAHEPDQMLSALQKLDHCNLVLIDTAGRSPKDHLHVKQLAELLGRVQPEEVHLVLSATCSAATAERVMRGFAPVEPSGMILTKLDEVDSCAALLPVIGNSAPPLTYLTTGQSVPDDIERAEARRLAERMLAR